MQRVAIIVPRSARWWLVSLSPLLFYDKIRVCNEDIHNILQQSGNSSFDERAATMLDMLLSDMPEPIVAKDESLPAGAKPDEIERQSQSISSLIINEAGKYSVEEPSLVKPQELKHALSTAYSHWIKYNRQKLRILRKEESLARVLRTERIPRWLDSERKIKLTDHLNLPNLLLKDAELRRVFDELVGRAILIGNLASDCHVKAHDSNIEEFLPTMELVERVRVFRDLPAVAQNPLDVSLLWQLYGFRIKKMQATSVEKVSLSQALASALKDRKTFESLRQRLAELDLLVEERTLDDAALMELFAIVSDINKTVRHVEIAGEWAMWGAGTYLFAEVASSLSPDVGVLLQSLLFNPLTVKGVKETVENFLIARKGLTPKCSSRISIIRDFVGGRGSDRLALRHSKTSPDVFRFWQ